MTNPTNQPQPPYPTGAPQWAPPTSPPAPAPAVNYQRPTLFVPPAPPQRHTLASPFRDGFLVGLGFIVASFVPIGALIVLIVTLAGIGSATAGGQ